MSREYASMFDGIVKNEYEEGDEELGWPTKPRIGLQRQW